MGNYIIGRFLESLEKLESLKQSTKQEQPSVSSGANTANTAPVEVETDSETEGLSAISNRIWSQLEQNWQALASLRHKWQQLEQHWGATLRLPLALMVASLLLLLSIVQHSLQIGQSLFRSYIWTQETQKAQLEVADLQKDIAVLEKAAAAANDPAYLEQLARCQGFVSKTETVVVDSNAKFNLNQNCSTLRVP